MGCESCCLSVCLYGHFPLLANWLKHVQASDVEWQLGQHSGASGVSNGSDDGDTEDQSEPAETAEIPIAVKVQIVTAANPADLHLLAAVVGCHWRPVLWQIHFAKSAATTGLHHRDLVCPTN